MPGEPLGARSFCSSQEGYWGFREASWPRRDIQVSETYCWAVAFGETVNDLSAMVSSPPLHLALLDQLIWSRPKLGD